jgi:hypothetical protein
METAKSISWVAAVSEGERIEKELTTMKRKFDAARKQTNRLRDALEFIADNGGKEVEGDITINCTGSWCADQARRALEEGI